MRWSNCQTKPIPNSPLVSDNHQLSNFHIDILFQLLSTPHQVRPCANNRLPRKASCIFMTISKLFVYFEFWHTLSQFLAAVAKRDSYRIQVFDSRQIQWCQEERPAIITHLHIRPRIQNNCTTLADKMIHASFHSSGGQQKATVYVITGHSMENNPRVRQSKNIINVYCDYVNERNSRCQCILPSTCLNDGNSFCILINQKISAKFVMQVLQLN